MLATGTVVDLGDSVANGIAAVAAIISIIALFTADSRAKDANRIALDANETAREARDIAHEANRLTESQLDYQARMDREARQREFREKSMDLLTQLISAAKLSEESKILPSMMAVKSVNSHVANLRPLFPGDSLMQFAMSVTHVATVGERYIKVHNFLGTQADCDITTALAEPHKAIQDLMSYSHLKLYKAFIGEDYLNLYAEIDRDEQALYVKCYEQLELALLPYGTKIAQLP